MGSGAESGSPCVVQEVIPRFCLPLYAANTQSKNHVFSRPLSKHLFCNSHEPGAALDIDVTQVSTPGEALFSGLHALVGEGGVTSAGPRPSAVTSNG